uniref:Calponin-homology (CH) domain-containing protein n=1 Tax=Timema bartmani TaxID=61472 RepID=A0A7R9ELP2_9NEOP|nr:unnamed protein product [Timema bartmani]
MTLRSPRAHIGPCDLFTCTAVELNMIRPLLEKLRHLHISSHHGGQNVILNAMLSGRQDQAYDMRQCHCRANIQRDMVCRMTSNFKMETAINKQEREEMQNCEQTFGSLASAKTILASGSTFILKRPTVDAGLTEYPKTTRLLNSQDEWDDDPSFDLDSAYDPDYEEYYYGHESNTGTVYEIQYYHSDSDTDSEFTTVLHQKGATTVQLDTFTSDTDSDSFPTGLNTVVQQNAQTNDRITELQQEHLATQKKIFTKWESMKVDNLFEDFKDGKKLIVLLEILTGDKLPTPSRGTMRVHSIENVNIALNFMQSRTRLQLIGAEDIVDGNPNLISGLVWLLIQTFQIESVLSPETTQLIEDETTKIMCAKETLLKWCQEQTKTYEGVDIKNFNHSWRDGLAFNAIIHSVYSNLIDYNALKDQDPQKNLRNAFKTASSELGIKCLLDPEGTKS